MWVGALVGVGGSVLGWVKLNMSWMLVDRIEAGVEEMQMLGEVNWM